MVGVASLVAAFSSSANAAPSFQFRNAIDHFSLDFAPRGAEVCAVAPPSSSDPSCRGFDLEAIRRPLLAEDEAVLVIREQATYLMTYGVRPKIPGSHWVSGVIAWTKAHHPGATVRPKYSEVVSREHVGLTEIMRIDLVVVDPSGARPAVEIVSWLVPGRDAFHVFDVQGPASSIALAQGDFQTALPTLSAALSPFHILWVLFVRFWFVPFVGALTVATLFAAYWLRRRSKRARRVASS